MKLLEFTVEATNAERKQIEQELSLAKEESNSRFIEINRLNTLLDNAKAKVIIRLQIFYFFKSKISSNIL